MLSDVLALSLAAVELLSDVLVSSLNDALIELLSLILKECPVLSDVLALCDVETFAETTLLSEVLVLTEVD